MKKRFLIFLLCGTVITFLVVITISAVTQEKGREPMAFVEYHKNGWFELVSSNNEVLPFLEKLYNTIDDELVINYRNGDLAANESVLKMFSPDELAKIEDICIKFQWETIRLRKETDTELKVLEVISSQMKFGKYLKKHFCTAVIVYSPNTELDSWEEISPNWYYKMYFET